MKRVHACMHVCACVYTCARVCAARGGEQAAAAAVRVSPSGIPSSAFLELVVRLIPSRRAGSLLHPAQTPGPVAAVPAEPERSREAGGTRAFKWCPGAGGWGAVTQQCTPLCSEPCISKGVRSRVLASGKAPAYFALPETHPFCFCLAPVAALGHRSPRASSRFPALPQMIATSLCTRAHLSLY